MKRQILKAGTLLLAFFIQAVCSGSSLNNLAELGYHRFGCLKTTLPARSVYLMISDTSLPDSLQAYYLVVTHLKKGTQKKVDQGRKVKIWVNDITYIDKIDSVTSDSLLISGTWISFKMIDKMRVHTDVTNILGGLVTALGAGTTPMGIVLFVQGIELMSSASQAGCFYAIPLFTGLFVAAMGIVLIPTGLITIASGIFIIVRGKNYNFHSKWKLSSGVGYLK
jgi:hypothetical protein